MNEKLLQYLALIEGTLYEGLSRRDPEYAVLLEAMEYSLKNGGKRVRPLLTLLFCEAAGGDIRKALPFAAAVEYVHTYSLIHDDLPCMDDDDYRRGKLSNHKVFGEAYALLAGDALLTAAFERIAGASHDGICTGEAASEAVLCLSALAGARGMVGGQVIDLKSEGQEISFDTLRKMDTLKTVNLIEAACTLGCIAAGASKSQYAAAKEYAKNLGLAFQMKDDILDVTSSLKELGKLPGSDAANKKATAVTLLGMEKCEELLVEMTKQALDALSVFGKAEDLREYAVFLLNRKN